MHMKKLFTLMAVALMSVTAADAAITVKNGNEEIKDGGVVTMTKANVKELAPGLGMYQAELKLSLETNCAPVGFEMKGDSSNITLCAGICPTMTDPDGDGVFTAKIDPTEQYSLLEIHGPLAAAPYEYKNSMDVVATDALGNKFSFKIVLDTTGESSVNGVVADKAVFSVKNGKAYVNGSANGVEVYNLLGQRVPNDALHGIYLVKAGKAVKKVVVK